MENKVYVVTVTYGNRFDLLKQVIDAALNEGVYKVIVVDNKSELESRNKLMEYEKLSNDKLKVLYLDDNYGSAGGFKKGLELAYSDPECEFIWLLDDDNKPMENSLKELLNFWYSLNLENKEEKVALLPYRFKRERLARQAVIYNKPELFLGFKNSFLRFHVKELIHKVCKHLKIRLKLIETSLGQENDVKFGKLPLAPYGGLFIHKNILAKVGYPDESLYLYEDDTEWTYRIKKMGGEIYLILESKIDDIELSTHVAKNEKQLAFVMLSRGEPYKIYYTIRNRVFFEKNNLLDNKIIYWINVFLYSLLISLSSCKKTKLILRAIKDGYRGNLGKVKF